MKTPGTSNHRILGESDWDEQDLLTFEDADERLVEEIGDTEAELRAAGEGPSPLVDRLKKRITQLNDSRKRLAAGPTNLAQIR